jgi:hypothetical protein
MLWLAVVALIAVVVGSVAYLFIHDASDDPTTADLEALFPRELIPAGYTERDPESDSEDENVADDNLPVDLFGEEWQTEFVDQEGNGVWVMIVDLHLSRSSSSAVEAVLCLPDSLRTANGDCITPQPGLYNFGDRPQFTAEGKPNGVDGLSYSFQREGIIVTLVNAGDNPLGEDAVLTILSEVSRRIDSLSR